jgi:hypothetical protein
MAKKVGPIITPGGPSAPTKKLPAKRVSAKK